MPKKIFQVILMIVIIAASMPSSLSFAESNSQEKYSLFVLGDSISTGYGLTGYFENKTDISSYANKLAQEFSSPEKYINKAIDGMTSAELLDAIQTGEFDSNIENSDIIVISIGGNDVLRMLRSTIMQAVGLDKNAPLSDLKNIDFTNEETMKQIGFFFLSGEYRVIFDKTINDFADNFTAISDHIYTQNPDAIVVYQTLFNPMSGVSNLAAVDMLCESCVDGINAVISENIWVDTSKTNHKYIIADVHTIFSSRGSELTRINSFDIHPNEEGHITIFEICKSALNNIIAEKKAEKVLEKETESQQSLQTASPEPESTQLFEYTPAASVDNPDLVVDDNSESVPSVVIYAVLSAAVIAAIALVFVKIKAKK